MYSAYPKIGSKGCSSRGTPNQRMMQDCRIQALDPALLPTSVQAISNYRQSGGHVTETSNFGNDPLEFFPEKQLFRDQAFKEKFPFLTSSIIN